MTWNPTNANDVSLVVSEVNRDDSGTRNGVSEIGTTSTVVVDDFSIGTEEDLTSLSGVGNPEALGISQGDVEHSFSFTIQGEDANLFSSLASDSTGQATEIEIVVTLESYTTTLTGAYAGTRNLSGSSGDAVEYEVEGVAKSRSNGTVSG
jgi:hypothetical protein